MKKIQCVIVDHDVSSQNTLKRHISGYERLKISGTAVSTSQALKMLSSQLADVVFLEPELPDMSGFELLNKLKYQPMVVFTTVHQDISARCFSYNVVDFLTKPVIKKSFARAAQRLFERHYSLNGHPDSDDSGIHRNIELNVNGQKVYVLSSEIKYAQSYGNYVRIHTLNGSLLVTTTTKNLMSLLPAAKFLRIQKSYIVNIGYVKSFNGCCVQIEKEILPVGISYRQFVENALRNNL